MKNMILLFLFLTTSAQANEKLWDFMYHNSQGLPDPGLTHVVAEMIKNDPTVDINFQKEGYPVLEFVVSAGVPELVKVFLDHSKLNLNYYVPIHGNVITSAISSAWSAVNQNDAFKIVTMIASDSRITNEICVSAYHSIQAEKGFPDDAVFSEFHRRSFEALKQSLVCSKVDPIK